MIRRSPLYRPIFPYCEIWEEAARDRLFPSADTRHQPRPAVSDEIYRRLTTEKCVTIGGIAGSGKSEAAAAYGAAHRLEYDLQIWLDGEEIRHVDDLAAAPLMRGQEKRNIASLMRTRRCLVVIDDPRTSLEVSALAALCGPDSRVLITIREIRTGVYEMPLMSPDEGRAVLNADVASPCPQNIFDIIWATIGGHPLSLALMNGAVREGASWRDIQDDCVAVGELPDPKQRLADRLLLRSRDLLQTALSVFEWAGQPDCDTGFLRFAVNPVGLRSLNTHGLTVADRDAIVRLHDVVFASLSSLDWWASDRRNELNDKLEAYLVAAFNRNDLSLWSAAGNLRRRLTALVTAGDSRPAFLLALLVTWTPEEADPGLLEDPVARAAELAAAGTSIAPIEFRVLIETVEQLYLRTKPHGRAAVTAFLEATLPIFDSLAALPGLTPRQEAEIHHHRGKFYRWLHRDADARGEFETVMVSSSPLDATRLQLIRLYKRENRFADAAALGESVLTTAELSGEVSPSVLLAVIQDLPWRDPSVRERLLRPKQAFIEHTIVSYANAGYDQAYRTLAAVARWWSQEAPDVLARVLGAIPPLSAERVHDDEDRFAFGDIRSHTFERCETITTTSQRGSCDRV
jgi:hypothetical protein